MATLKDLYLEVEHKKICAQENCTPSIKSKEKCGRCFRMFLKGRTSAIRKCQIAENNKRLCYELTLREVCIKLAGTYKPDCSRCNTDWRTVLSTYKTKKETK
jgi:hypothetical protein